MGWKVEHEYQKKVSKELMKDKKSKEEGPGKISAAQMTEFRINKGAKEFIDDSI
jgi:hypothetical protein